jgi:hypothetical protein
MLKFFWNIAFVFKNDATRFINENFVDRRAIRALQLRVQSFIFRIEIEDHKRFVFDVVQRTNSLFAQLMTQTIRITNDLTREMNRFCCACDSQNLIFCKWTSNRMTIKWIKIKKKSILNREIKTSNCHRNRFSRSSIANALTRISKSNVRLADYFRLKRNSSSKIMTMLLLMILTRRRSLMMTTTICSRRTNATLTKSWRMWTKMKLLVVKRTMMKILFVMFFVIEISRLINVNVFNAFRCVFLFCDDFVIAMFFFQFINR